MNDHSEDKRSPYSIAWRDQFRVDIPQVDAEHKRLFSLVKSLSLESADETVEELLEYVVLHFTNEQGLMERSGYPAFDQHLKFTKSSVPTWPIFWAAARPGVKSGCKSCAAF